MVPPSSPTSRSTAMCYLEISPSVSRPSLCLLSLPSLPFWAIVSAPFSCPPGFYLANENACAFDCPSPLLTDNQFYAITTMLRFVFPLSFRCIVTKWLCSVMAWVSLVATGFLFVTLILDPGKRQFPSGKIYCLFILR